MKTMHFATMIISSVIILTSMSECEKGLAELEEMPITACINGEEFKSAPELIYSFFISTCWHANMTCGGFSVYRELGAVSETQLTDSLCLYLDVANNAQFELDCKYPLTKRTHIELRRNNCDYYVLDEGWLSFSQIIQQHESSSYIRVSGEFEFTSIEETYGDTLKVTSGKFENLLTYKSSAINYLPKD